MYENPQKTTRDCTLVGVTRYILFSGHSLRPGFSQVFKEDKGYISHIVQQQLDQGQLFQTTAI